MALGRTQDRPVNIIDKRLKEINYETKNIKEIEKEQNLIEENKTRVKSDIDYLNKKLSLLNEYKIIDDKEKVDKENIKFNLSLMNEYEERLKDLKVKKEQLINEKTKFENSNNIKGYNKILYVIVFLLILLVTIVNFILIKNSIVNYLSVGTLIIYVLIALFNYKKKKTNIIKYKNEIQKYEDKIYLIENEQDDVKNIVIKKKEELSNQEYNLAEWRKNQIKGLCDKFSNLFNNVEINNICNNQNINNQIVFLQNELNEVNLELYKLNIDNSNINEKVDRLAELEEERQELLENYKNLLEKNEEIEMAKQEITNAYAEMKEKVSPQYTKKMSYNISNITNGKYKNIKVNDDSIIMVETYNGNYIPIYNLSIGTIEQLYLSLRLSFIDDISLEKLPIMLDEAFAYFDNERTENFLNYLNKYYQNRQIIIFTCNDKEQKICDKLNIEYNLINM